jgi:putative phosphoesterase
MASPRGPDPEKDLSYCLYGTESLTRLLKALENQIEGVRESDEIEYIHKMRVASRRIRAALPLFKECFPKKLFKKWLREIRRVTKSLGATRDADVQIAFVTHYLERLKDEKIGDGVRLLLSKHRDRRARMQPEINEGLDQLRNSHVIENMRSYCEQVKQQANIQGIPIDSSSTYAKAHAHISEKLTDFLAMEDCVHRENDILNHHEMRIRAKWLRYTMEIFSPNYDDKMEEYISTAQHFQDILGELHDYDVWINYIPKFISEIRYELFSNRENTQHIITVEKGLVQFLQDIQEMRRSKYREFVSFWEEVKERGAFEQLRQITVAEFMGAEKGVKSLLEAEHPKVAVLADVHANQHALNAVLEHARSKDIEIFVNAGDSVGYCAFPNEAVETLRLNRVLSVIGNYDLRVLEAKREADSEKDVALKFARKRLSRTNKVYLNSLPREIRLEIKGKRLLVVHGSPESIEEHLYRNTPKDRLRAIARNAEADIIVVGHSHRQFHRRVDAVTFVNPGSVGRPYDRNPEAGYAIFNFNPLSVELIRVRYDVEAAAQAIRKEGLPEHFAQMALRGVSLTDIIKDERAVKRKAASRRKGTAEIVRKVARKYENESSHSEQVTKLAMDLFDSLKKVHTLGTAERHWLEYAAILHDIGWSRGASGHNKNSLKLILNESELPFTSTERYAIGSIARYHRKKAPSTKHYNYAALDPGNRRRVTALSAILRVADALDFSHRAIVRKMEVAPDPMTVTIKCTVNQNPILEEQSLNKKKDIFVDFFKKNLVVLWTYPP